MKVCETDTPWASKSAAPASTLQVPLALIVTLAPASVVDTKGVPRVSVLLPLVTARMLSVSPAPAPSLASRLRLGDADVAISSSNNVTESVTGLITVNRFSLILAEPLRAVSTEPSPLVSCPTDVMRTPKSAPAKSAKDSGLSFSVSKVNSKLRTSLLPIPDVPISRPTSYPLPSAPATLVALVPSALSKPSMFAPPPRSVTLSPVTELPVPRPCESVMPPPKITLPEASLPALDVTRKLLRSDSLTSKKKPRRSPK